MKIKKKILEAKFKLGDTLVLFWLNDFFQINNLFFNKYDKDRDFIIILVL